MRVHAVTSGLVGPLGSSLRIAYTHSVPKIRCEGAGANGYESVSMTTAEWVAIIIALISAASNIVLGVMNFRVAIKLAHVQAQLTEKSEERKELRQRVKLLKATAARLRIMVGGWDVSERAEELLQAQLDVLADFVPHFVEYPEVASAIEEFRLKICVVDDARHEVVRNQPAGLHESLEFYNFRIEQLRLIRDVEMPKDYEALVVAANALLAPPVPNRRRLVAWIARMMTRWPAISKSNGAGEAVK